jgi:hypothetical protein
LPNRATRGIPRVNYELVFSANHRYLMSNYVSYYRLSKKSKSFTNQLSIIFIPTNIQEAMNEEMKSLSKNSTWEVIELPKKTSLLDVDGFSYSKTSQKEPLNGLKHKSPKGTLKLMKLTT